MTSPLRTDPKTVGNQNLLRLAEILDAADAEHAARGEPAYYQESYSHPCGTPACALGHWGAANPNTWAKCAGWWTRKNRSPNDYWDGAMEDFAITDEEGALLFGMRGCGRAKTAKQAADYIRSFVRNRS